MEIDNKVGMRFSTGALLLALLFAVFAPNAMAQKKWQFEEVNGNVGIQAVHYSSVKGPYDLRREDGKDCMSIQLGTWTDHLAYEIKINTAGTYRLWTHGRSCGGWGCDDLKVFWNRKVACCNYDTEIKIGDAHRSTKWMWNKELKEPKDAFKSGIKVDNPGWYTLYIVRGAEPEGPGHTKAREQDRQMLHRFFLSRTNTTPTDANFKETVYSAGNPATPQPTEPNTPTEPTGPTSKPDKVSGLSITEVNTTSITLKWEPNAQASSYDVYWSNVTTPDATTDESEYTISGLSPNREYDIWVKAKNTLGAASGVLLKATTKSDASTGIHMQGGMAFTSAAHGIAFGAAMAGKPIRILNLDGSTVMHATLDETGVLELFRPMKSGIYILSLEGKQPSRIFYGN